MYASIAPSYTPQIQSFTESFSLKPPTLIYPPNSLNLPHFPRSQTLIPNLRSSIFRFRQMDLDPDVSRWVLELLLRDREKESVAKRVLAAVPLSDHDWRLKKTLLLRTIESQVFDEASISESILESLESIEVIDRGQGIPVTDAMRAAYCAVATELTVRFLVCEGKPGGKYMEAVDRIWRGRVRVLEESEGCEMVSAEWKERRDEVEAAIWDRKVSKKLASLNSRNDALRLVWAYVKEAMAMLGPPFIAWAVKFTENGSLSSEGDQVPVEKDGSVGDGCEGRVPVANGVDLEVQTLNGADLVVGMANGVGSDNVNSVSEQEVETANGANDVSNASELEAHDTIEGDESEQDVQNANGAIDVSNVSGREGHDTIEGDESELQVVTVSCVNSMSEMDFHTASGAQLQVAGAGRSPPNVLSFGPTTKEKETLRTTAPRRRHGPAKLRDDEDLCKEASTGIYNPVPSAEVRKVQKEFKSSVLALQAVVTDPLPYALRVSEMVRSELGVRPVDLVSKENGGASNLSVEKNAEPDQSNNDNHGNQTNHQNVPQPIGNDAPNLSVDMGKGTKNAGMGDVNPGNPSCSHQNNVSRAGLMERNSTAHTYEWDDSLGMSPEQTNSKGRLHLPSPKRIAVSSLQKYEDKRVIKRRKVKRWSLQEEDTLRTGVQKYGAGNWKLILGAYRDAFEERTEVDLKDKWRNMMK